MNILFVIKYCLMTIIRWRPIDLYVVVWSLEYLFLSQKKDVMITSGKVY